MKNILTIKIEEATNGFVVRFGDTNKPCIFDDAPGVQEMVSKEVDDFLALVYADEEEPKQEDEPE